MKTILQRYNFRLFNLLLLIFFSISSCKIERLVDKGHYLLDKVNIVCDNKALDKDDMLSYVKQKPNKRILGVRVYVYAYNCALRDTSGMKRIRRWFAKTVGDKPIIYDAGKQAKSKKQICIYLRTKGYYDATVKDSVAFDDKRKRAKVFYTIKSGKIYLIKEIKDSINDDEIAAILKADKVNTLIKPGMPFDLDILQNERARIADTLKNKGYFFFQKEYISYEADTTVGKNMVNICSEINNPKIRLADNSLRSSMHKKYTINQVYIYPSFDARNAMLKDTAYYNHLDTIAINKFNFVYPNPSKIRPEIIRYKRNSISLHPNPLNIKPNIILQGLYFEPGSGYNADKVKNTYSYFSGLRRFKLTNISFYEVAGNDSSGRDSSQNKLNCHIQLTPATTQSFTVELEGTNSSGNYGAAGNLLYQHNNIFKGAEILNTKFKGAIETQRDVFGSGGRNFNTIELGAEARIEIPKFLAPISYERFNRQYMPKTVYTLAINFQQRPDYTRTLFNASFGYTWKKNQFLSYTLNPLDINFVKLPKISVPFFHLIDSLGLRYSYEDHLIVGSSFSLVYNNQNLKKKKNFMFFRFNTEIAGNALTGMEMLLNEPKYGEEQAYNIFGNRFAQYVKADVEYRHYAILNSKSKIVLRGFAGAGLPYGNVNVLPFSKRYFAGGANSIRGWTVRSLGPGSYRGNTGLYPNQSADLKLEANVELRFKMFWVIEGALFYDVGNIWDIKENKERPEAVFQANTFYKELAMGTGLGFRFDFSFFIFRCDFGLRVHDPRELKGERWVLNHLGKYHFGDLTALNFGIGYPF